MIIKEALVKNLDLSKSAAHVTSKALDRLPILAIDKCLVGAEGALARQAAALATAGFKLESETLTMPRASAGLRPINILSPISRTLYSSLVDRLSASLPASSRDFAGWNAHTAFGRPELSGGDGYIVDTDITSCYEYIEHDLLRQELLVQTMDVEGTDSVTALLGEIFGKDRGLPQLLTASDLLADTYLLPIERSLLRRGYSVSRFADDFRVLADDWSQANDIIEYAAETARRFGLVLSSAKTLIRKASTLIEREEEKTKFLRKYVENAKDELSFWDILFEGDYGPVEVLVEPDDEDAEYEGLRNLVREWVEGPRDAYSTHAKYVRNALTVLRKGPERLKTEWLRDIVFRDPLVLENVAGYILARDEPDENWSALSLLVGMQRQSPWAKLWLLHVAENLPPYEGEAFQSVSEWSGRQLRDRHETVRAQAAWYCSATGGLTDGTLAELYGRATRISAPALAASLARSGTAKSASIARAIRGESPLNSAAFDLSAP